jgi:hypothetical protein
MGDGVLHNRKKRNPWKEPSTYMGALKAIAAAALLLKGAPPEAVAGVLAVAGAVDMARREGDIGGS